MHRLEQLNTITKISTTFSPTSLTRKILENNLYSINLINKNVNRSILSMYYSPGVGAVCQAITKNTKITDTMTLRGRSVAIVTDGSCLDADEDSIKPVMDWFIAQIKYYSGVDSFPFVISKSSNLSDIFLDLSTSYTAILYLDNKQINQIPQNIALVRQQDVVNEAKCQLTDAKETANLLAYLIEIKFKGVASSEVIKKGLDFQANNFESIKPYGVEINDGRNLSSHALQIHQFYQGKIHIEVGFHDINKLKPHFTEEKLRQLIKQKNVYSKSSQLCAIVTDGTSVLGFGNIGPMAGLPVMEGKSLLFKLLGDVEVVPICIYPRKSTEEQVTAIRNLSCNFHAINLEDIKAPECFEIESGLQRVSNIPIFHDDQHGTAIVTLAALINATKVVGKKMGECKCVINGAGAAGVTITNLLLDYGIKDIIVCDSTGSIYRGRTKNMNDHKQKLAEVTNKENKNGTLSEVIEGCDVFIGVSSGGALKGQDVRKMNKKSIVFAMANPLPEIMIKDAKENGAYIYGSGRADLENQINNSLVFPGIFRAIMEHKIKVITNEMKIKAAEAIAASLTELPRPNYIVPDSLDKDVAIRISRELGKIAKTTSNLIK